MSPLLQTLVVAAVVGLSLLSLLRKLAPAMMWQAQARLSYWLERETRPALLHRLGRALRPSLQATTGACGTGCSTCKACK
ncbi:MAG TPA: DUF6587 family protein [Arenimonas sp.]|uniref:DUF6587 family protein n=1 Tax=Arenimonas sp. TaxID=1872635 RepID=UPI002D80F3A7|nr:DUF6587 family protein [Arenimonas sp.]HEU0152367.1 DUF6587 family protein [Arenimonas sp.]